MTSRISRSAVDWAKFAQVIQKHEKTKFNQFKARSDMYLSRVLSYPEQPPAIDFNKYKQDIKDKDVVAKLEAAYKAVQVPYPKDDRSHEVDAQEKQAAQDYEFLKNAAVEKVREAEEYKHKFEVMIPYQDMSREDYDMTFPEWVPSTRTNPTIFPSEACVPGLTKEERAKAQEMPGPPYTIP